jgi:hypothetical protein
MANCAYIVDYGSLDDGFNKLAASASAASIACSVAETEFPVSNLVNRISSKPCKFNTKTGIEIDIDFGSSQECQFIAIVGHKFSSSATITLENDDNAGMTSPDLSHSVTWHADAIYIVLSANYTNRYWRLSIDDASNTYNPWIGELVMGNLIEFSQNMDWKVQERTNFNSIQHKTDFELLWTYYLSKTTEIRAIDFKNVTNDTADELLTMIEATYGSRYPLVLVWDQDDFLSHSVYGKLSDQMTRTFNYVDVNDVKGITIKSSPFANALDDS